MNRVVPLTDPSIASSIFPEDSPPASPNSGNSKAVTSASMFKAGRATLVMRIVALALFLGVALPAAAQDTQRPSVPAGLTGTVVSSSQINLTWTAATDNVGVKGYQVFLNDRVVSTTTTTSFQHTGLSAGTTYNYRVNAFDAAWNYSGWTVTPVAVRTLGPAADTQPPSVPTGLAGTAASSTQVNLTWNASTDNVGVTGYYVYLDNVALGVTTKTSFQHIGRTAGTTYSYRVSAYDAVPNHSAWTTPVSVKTTGIAPLDTSPPSVPAGLTGTAASNTEINLTWTAATDNVGVKGYQVFLNDRVISTTTTTSFKHTGLAAGTTYNYRVNAFDAASNYSGWTVTPVAVTTKTQAQPGTVQFFATFTTDPFRSGTGDGVCNNNVWWVEQKAGTNRATVVYAGRDGGTALRLHTEPGDNNVSGSGSHERNDVALSQSSTDGYQGREAWWAHSVQFPSDYVTPPAGHWGTIFDFHDTRNQGGQANFHIFTGTDGRMSFRGHAGPYVVINSAGNEYSYGADAGPVVKGGWYDFVYHVKWSSGTDGFFKAWVNGVLKLDHRGPTLYQGYGVYLKLANYHSAFGQSTSVIHDRVIRGTTALSVAAGPLQGVSF